MAAAPISAVERTPDGGYSQNRLERAERQAPRLLDARLQVLVQRVAALVGAPRASLAVLDPVSQAPVMAATYSRSFSGPPPATLRVHADIACWVTKHRAAAIIADFAGDPHARALGLIAVGSLLSVPLLSGQQVLGALTISSPSISAFNQHHLRLLEMVADLGALAIFQARQLDAVAQQTRPGARPLEVSPGQDTTPNARAIFGLAVAAIRRLVPCEEAVIFSYDAGTEILSGVAGLGIQSARLAESHIRLRDPQSVTAWVAQQRRPLLFTSGTTGFIGQATEALLAEREMALLAVPIVTHEQLWGVITLARSAPFDTNELRTMLNLSQMIAPALAQIGHAR
jgi:GAF domain-containing protein